MGWRSDKAFSLLEVVVTVAIVSLALVFVLRGFSVILSSARLSQDITLACLLAEEKIWEVENGLATSGSRSQEIQARQFGWEYRQYPETSAPAADLVRLDLSVTWDASVARKEKLDISTYLLS